VSTSTAIASGELGVVTDTVARRAGREPATLADVLRSQPDALAHVGAG
jgi:hypothetical protein